MIKTSKDMLSYLNRKSFPITYFIRLKSIIDASQERIRDLFYEKDFLTEYTSEDFQYFERQIRIILTYPVMWCKHWFQIKDDVSLDFKIDFTKKGKLKFELPEWINAFNQTTVTFYKNSKKPPVQITPSLMDAADNEIMNGVVEANHLTPEEVEYWFDK